MSNFFIAVLKVLGTETVRKTAKAFFQNESHGLYRRAPYGDQLSSRKAYASVSLRWNITQRCQPTRV